MAYTAQSIEVSPKLEAFLEIWDISGSSCKSDNMMESYLTDVSAIIFVYDPTSPESFAQIEPIRKVVDQHLPKNLDKKPLFVLMSTKSDLAHHSKVKVEQHNEVLPTR